MLWLLAIDTFWCACILLSHRTIFVWVCVYVWARAKLSCVFPFWRFSTQSYYHHTFVLSFFTFIYSLAKASLLLLLLLLSSIYACLIAAKNHFLITGQSNSRINKNESHKFILCLCVCVVDVFEPLSLSTSHHPKPILTSTTFSQANMYVNQIDNIYKHTHADLNKFHICTSHTKSFIYVYIKFSRYSCNYIRLTYPIQNLCGKFVSIQ